MTREEFVSLIISILAIIAGAVSIPVLEYDATFALIIWAVAVANIRYTLWS